MINLYAALCTVWGNARRCMMIRLSFSRLLNVSSQFKISSRNVVDADSKLERLISHVYGKTWNKKQLIEYIKDNVVFESEKYIVTSVPQGIALKKTSQWADTVTPLTSEADLNEILKELPAAFNTENLLLALYPRSNTSGLTIFAKSYQDKTYLASNINLAKSKNYYSYTFLAVVLGCPEQQRLIQSFGIKANKFGEKYKTELLQNWNDSDKIEKVCYRHTVLASSSLASLVKVEVSQDKRDCVRHILGTRCLTPVLGDVWNCSKKKSTFLNSPLVVDPIIEDNYSVSLDPELLAKLDLKPGDENIIPIHVHLHSLRVEVKNNKLFFVSVPPPESFTWTCHQLGFEEIRNYQKVE